MAIMSSFRFLLVSLAVILLNENLLCKAEPYQPLSTYHGNYQPALNTVQQPVAYHAQPALNTIQQPMVYHAQPGSYQPVATAFQPGAGLVQPQLQVHYIQTRPAQKVEYIKPSQQVEYIKPSQQVEYIKPSQQVEYIKPSQQVEYLQPSQQVEYVQPSVSGAVKPINPQKQFIKKHNPQVVQSKPTDQNAQPVKYSIPTANFVAHQTPSQAYYSMPTTYPQSYTLPQTSFTTYPQGHVIPEVSYPQGYPVPETSYPQVYPTPETSYPQGYQILGPSYPHSYPIPETSYPHGYPIPETSYPQGYPIPETSYPQGYPVPETSYPQGYPVPVTSYPQGYQPVGNALPKIVQGRDYIDASPRYLLQDTRSAVYPYGNPNVLIFPGTNKNGEVNQLPKTVNTSAGKIHVELIDVMPYKPGSEPNKKVPRIDSIEAIIKPEKSLEEDIDIDENNSLEPTTTGSSFSLFK